MTPSVTANGASVLGPHECSVRGATQESGVDERTHQRIARGTMQAPQPLRLRRRQAESGHLDIRPEHAEGRPRAADPLLASSMLPFVPESVIWASLRSGSRTVNTPAERCHDGKSFGEGCCSGSGRIPRRGAAVLRKAMRLEYTPFRQGIQRQVRCVHAVRPTPCDT